jgi:aspartyl-tRNA(Asn)/glutamyl-tRNA(Gln) amidotransferase subunit A
MNDMLFSFINSDPVTANSDGPLKNLRISLHPNISVAKWPTDAGSAALKNYRPIEDATVVKRLKDQGAQLQGLTRMGELGFGVASDTAHLLISQKKSDAALVVDTMGEARYLSALAGAWGFKPSYGICSRSGLIGLVPSMECISTICASARQMADIFSVIHGQDANDFSMLWDGLPEFDAPEEKTGQVRQAGIISEQLAELDAQEKKAFENALAGLTQKGIKIKECAFPSYPLFRDVHQTKGSTEASSAAGRYDSVRYGRRAKDTANWNDMYLESRKEMFGSLVKSYLFQGAYFQFKNYDAFEHAARLRGLLVKQCRSLFKDVDIILSPARRRTCDALKAETVSDVYDAFALTLPASVTGSPSVCMPGRVMAGDMDLGLQVIGPHLSDKMLLNFAIEMSQENTRN